MKRVLIVLTMSLFPASINATDKNDDYRTSIVQGIMGSCASYVASRDSDRRGNHVPLNAHTAWLFGYITAINRLQADTWDIQGGQDLEAILLWLENYCKKNPLERFAGAVAVLTVELYPKRIRQKPKE
jgi:hypothetical protein